MKMSCEFCGSPFFASPYPSHPGMYIYIYIVINIFFNSSSPIFIHILHILHMCHGQNMSKHCIIWGYGHPSHNWNPFFMAVSYRRWIDDHPIKLVLIDPIMLIIAMDPREYAHHIHEYPMNIPLIKSS